jgi:hypothetical protein
MWVLGVLVSHLNSATVKILSRSNCKNNQNPDKNRKRLGFSKKEK